MENLLTVSLKRVVILEFVVLIISSFTFAQEWGKELFDEAAIAIEDPFKNYQIATRLRLGDIEVITNDNKIKGLEKALKYYEDADNATFRMGKEEVDREFNEISFLYYIQSLIASDKDSEAVVVCHEERIWDNHRPIKDERVKYLEAYALWKESKKNDAEVLLDKIVDEFPFAHYLLGQIDLKEKKWKEAIGHFQSLIDTYASIPNYIYMPYLKDGFVLDDAYFFMAVSYDSLGDEDSAMLSLGKLIRYFTPFEKTQDAIEQINRLLYPTTH